MRRDSAAQRWLVMRAGQPAAFYAWAVTWFGAREQGARAFRCEAREVSASPSPPTTNESCGASASRRARTK